MTALYGESGDLAACLLQPQGGQKAHIAGAEYHDAANFTVMVHPGIVIRSLSMAKRLKNFLWQSGNAVSGVIVIPIAQELGETCLSR